MAITGITDAMHQYSKATEVIYMNKPKYSKPYGIKQPDAKNLVATLAIIFMVLVVFATSM